MHGALRLLTYVCVCVLCSSSPRELQDKHDALAARLQETELKTQTLETGVYAHTHTHTHSHAHKY